MTRDKKPAAQSDLTVISKWLGESRDVFERALADPGFLATVAAVAEVWSAALAGGHKILLCGNGGSAADAQHIAAELLSRFQVDRAPLPAVALTVDTSVLTGIANDYGYDHVFSRQVRGLGRPGDVLVAISTSGRSPNVLAALDAARSAGLITVGFSSASAGVMAGRCDHLLRVPSDTTALVQQVHIAVAHCLCQMVEQTALAKTKNQNR